MINSLKPFLGMKEFKSEFWKKIIEVKNQKEQIEMPSVNKVERVMNKITNQHNLNKEKNKLYYENHRKLSSSLKNHRSLNKVRSEHSVSFGKYVQSHLR
jgi:hypothetical protein